MSLLDGAVLDLAGLQQFELLWATNDLVDLALAAAESLPEWSPSAAIPSDFGIVGWSKPIGSFDCPVPGSDQVVRVPIDACCPRRVAGCWPPPRTSACRAPTTRRRAGRRRRG